MGFYKKVKTYGMSCVLDMNNSLSYPHKTHLKKFCGVVHAPDQPTNTPPTPQTKTHKKKTNQTTPPPPPPQKKKNRDKNQM